MVEKDFGPVTELILSLVEIGSLVESTGPLDQLVVGWLFFDIFGGAKISVVEFLFPSFHFIDAKLNKIIVSDLINEFKLEYS